MFVKIGSDFNLLTKRYRILSKSRFWEEDVSALRASAAARSAAESVGKIPEILILAWENNDLIWSFSIFEMGSKTKGKVEKPFVGLLRCDECGRMITAEIQKGHTYYRCMKKNIVCSQPYVREEELDRQLSSLLQKFSLRLAGSNFVLANREARKTARMCLKINERPQRPHTI